MVNTYWSKTLKYFNFHLKYQYVIDVNLNKTPGKTVKEHKFFCCFAWRLVKPHRTNFYSVDFSDSTMLIRFNLEFINRFTIPANTKVRRADST